MRAEHAVRIGVLARDDALELVRGRHAAAPLRGGPASSVRCGEQSRHRHGEPSPFERNPAPRYVPSRRAAGYTCVRVRRLARRRRAVVVADAARSRRPTARARPTPRPRRSRAGRACWPSRTRPSATPRSPRSAPRTPTGSATGSASRAPAPPPTRCASSASGARCARYAAERGVRLIGDIPLYVGAAQRRPRARIPSSSSAASSRALRRTRSSAAGQLWGNPLYDWPALRTRRLSLVDRAPAARGRARRPEPHRPLPRLRRVLVGARARAPARARDAGGAARAPRLFAAAQRELGELAADRRGSRRDHAAGRAAAARARLPGHGRAAVRLRRRRRATRTGRRTTSSCSSSTRARTTRDTARRLVGRARRRGRRRRPGSTPPSRTGRCSSWRSESRAVLAILPAQDVLGLGSEARMNRPGIAEGNWAGGSRRAS